MFKMLKVKTFVRGMRVITLNPNPGLITLVRILISAPSVFLGRVKWGHHMDLVLGQTCQGWIWKCLSNNSQLTKPKKKYLYGHTQNFVHVHKNYY